MSVIGRSAVVKYNGQFFTVTVIDAYPPDNEKPKRVRIQSKGKRQGDVLMPNTYVIHEYV